LSEVIVMNPEAAIWRAALVVVRRHGPDATLAVAAYAQQFIEDGDITAAAACERVLSAIKLLQATAPAEGERVH
jgi:hypothetical protein